MQVQLRYDPYEDRIILILEEDGQAVSWWLTRRGAIMLMTALAARARESLAAEDSGEAKSLLLDSRQEQAAQNLSDTEPPIAADNPVLLVTIQHGGQENGGHYLNLFDATGRGYGLAFDDESLFSLIELVKQQTAQAEWNIDFTWPTAEPAASDRCLHLQ